MAGYTITVTAREEDLSFERIRRGLKSETIEMDAFGDVAEIVGTQRASQCSTCMDCECIEYIVTVRMTGATDEAARRMEGRHIPHLDLE